MTAAANRVCSKMAALNRFGAMVLLSLAFVVVLWAGDFEPFIAKTRHTSTITVDGKVVKFAISEHTYMRASNGSVRHEIRELHNGVPSTTPISITLSDVVEQKTYSLDDAKKIALVASSFNDPRQQYQDSFNTAGHTLQTYMEIPCVSLTSVFQANGKTVSTGTSCRAVNYGIMIHEIAEIPDPKTGGTLEWKTDLVNFFKTEPSANLMKVLLDYQQVQSTALGMPPKPAK